MILFILFYDARYMIFVYCQVTTAYINIFTSYILNEQQISEYYFYIMYYY